ncbi:testis-expressed protein 36 isoform 3-T3 [Lycaon pictus]
MAKGRRFNPALDKDGRWFPQIGLTQKTPESSTSAVLKEPHRPHLSRQVEEKLPPIYKVREKQAVNNNFPFSVHDNRHSFQSSGCYLDSMGARIRRSVLRLHQGAGLAASLVAATTSCQQNKCNRHPGSCRCSQDYKRP